VAYIKYCILSRTFELTLIKVRPSTKELCVIFNWIYSLSRHFIFSSW